MVNVTLAIETDRVRLLVGEPPPAGAGGDERRSEFHGSVCGSALCHCCNVTFVERADEVGGGPRPREFVLDPFERCAGETQPAEPAEVALAQHVAKAMDAESWKKLLTVFLAVKARALEEIDFERERADFRFEAIERDAELVAYHETFPFAPDIQVVDGSRVLLVDEQHCVRPDCCCDEATLTVFAVESRATDRVPDAATQVAALRVDLRRERWSDPDTDGPLSAAALEVRRLLLAQHPDLLDTLQRQQALLRRLYRVAAASAGRARSVRPAPSVAGPRTGRNDPCPCGSGKKFKRCCESR